MDVELARSRLIPRIRLSDSGMSSRRLDEELSSGRLRRVHPGWYLDGALWADAYAEDRHLYRVVAAAAGMRSDRTYVSHDSAAVLWRLPLYRSVPRLVHVSGDNADGCTGRRATGVARHAVAVPDPDRAEVSGIRCTSLERTVTDMLRSASPEGAIAIADAALRRIAWNERTRAYDIDAAEIFRSRLLGRIRAGAGGRGIRQARWLAPLADGRAHLPGESVSRLRLHQLGFAPPRLQVAVPAPTGSVYFCDFGLDDVGVWGEFDGLAKYLDPDLTGEMTPGEAVLAEKARENWIVATTGRRVVRWSSEHIASPEAFARHLATYAIHPPR